MITLTVKDTKVLRDLGLIPRLITVKNPVAVHARNVTEECIVIQIGNLLVKTSTSHQTMRAAH